MTPKKLFMLHKEYCRIMGIKLETKNQSIDDIIPEGL